MLYDNSKWRDKFYSKAIDIIWEEVAFNAYFKEKYWRFDTSYWWDKPWIQDKLLELEDESEKCCQKCGKHRYQIWKRQWRVEHFCIPCYIRFRLERFINIAKKKLKV